MVGDIADLRYLKGSFEMIFLIRSHEGRADLHKDEHEDAQNDCHDGRFSQVQDNKRRDQDPDQGAGQHEPGLQAGIPVGQRIAEGAVVGHAVAHIAVADFPVRPDADGVFPLVFLHEPEEVLGVPVHPQDGSELQRPVDIVIKNRRGKSPGIDFVSVFMEADTDSPFIVAAVSAEPDIDRGQRLLLESGDLLLQDLPARQGDLLGGLQGIRSQVKAVGRVYAEKRDPDQGQNNDEGFFRRKRPVSASAFTLAKNRQGTHQPPPHPPVSCQGDQLQDDKEKQSKGKYIFKGTMPCTGTSSADQQQDHGNCDGNAQDQQVPDLPHRRLE